MIKFLVVNIDNRSTYTVIKTWIIEVLIVVASGVLPFQLDMS